MENNEKIKSTYTKDMLIRNIAKECGRDIKVVRLIYDALEDNVTELLSSADENQDVSVRLFEGISITSTFVPEKTKVNNLTGEVITTKAKVRPKANITRNYCGKLTNFSK